jgi:hypothetical protein
MTHQNIEGRKTAGAFDIRNVIGALLGLYGIVLLLTAAFRNGAPKGTHNNDNWWGGGALLLVGLIFLAWAKLRPIVVTEQPKQSAQPPTADRPGDRRPGEL